MRALAILALLAVGCGSGSEDGTTDRKEQARPYITISVTPTNLELVPGQTAQLQVLLMSDDGTGSPVGGTFQSNNEQIATVDQNSGLVRAVAKGTTNVRASYGPGSAYVPITVK